MITAIVIDDDLDTCDVLSDYLELKQINVLACGHNGKEAVDLYKKYVPDIVFLDVMMPEYDGFYALEKIKQLKSTAYVITITGDLTTETYNKLRTMNSSAIIYKPFDIEKVMMIVKELTSEKLCNFILQQGR